MAPIPTPPPCQPTTAGSSAHGPRARRCTPAQSGGFAPIVQLAIPVGLGMVVQHALQPLFGLPPGAGTPRRQARPGPAPPAAQAGQLRLLLLDDLGYLPQGAEESEVLFTLIAERYERRSLGITSNLVFSEWERIFANPMATAAAIDRVVHHSVILEFDVPSYRTNAAQQRGQAKEVNRQN